MPKRGERGGMDAMKALGVAGALAVGGVAKEAAADQPFEATSERLDQQYTLNLELEKAFPGFDFKVKAMPDADDDGHLDGYFVSFRRDGGEWEKNVPIALPDSPFQSPADLDGYVVKNVGDLLSAYDRAHPSEDGPPGRIAEVVPGKATPESVGIERQELVPPSEFVEDLRISSDAARLITSDEWGGAFLGDGDDGYRIRLSREIGVVRADEKTATLEMFVDSDDVLHILMTNEGPNEKPQETLLKDGRVYKPQK